MAPFEERNTTEGINGRQLTPQIDQPAKKVQLNPDGTVPTEPPPKEYLELSDQDEVLLPDMDVVYWRHMLLSPHCPDEKKAEVKGKLIERLKENRMHHCYVAYCEEHSMTPDKALVDEWRTFEEKELKMIDQAEQYCKENLGDSEVRDQLMRRAHLICELGDFDRAIEAYEVALTKSVGISSKLHVALTIIRIGLAKRDVDLVETQIKRAKDLLEQGGDWERRNKLKIYEAMYLVLIGHLDKASTFLVNALSTFSATELLQFESFVLYAVCLALIAETRQNYKKSIFDSPEVHQVAGDDAALETFATAFYQGDFAEGMKAILDISDRLKYDFYFGSHLGKYLIKLRIKSYKSFLKPFSNVKISTMSKRFGLPEELIESEVSTFISSGHLKCRVDLVDRIIYALSDTEDLLADIVEEGDKLQTKIQKLSRIMYM